MDYRPYKRTNYALSYSMRASVDFARWVYLGYLGNVLQVNYTSEGSVHLILGSEVVVLLLYVHGKHLRSCRDDQLT